MKTEYEEKISKILENYNILATLTVDHLSGEYDAKKELLTELATLIQESNEAIIRDVGETDTIILTKEDLPNADEIYSIVKQTKSMVAKRLRDKYISTKSDSKKGENPSA